jgi:uncharacterized membrane protein
VVEAPEQPAAPRRRLPAILTRWRYDYIGLWFALVFFCLSVTPSLLPRGWAFQGVLTGVLTATGYGLGMLTQWAVRRLIGREYPLVRPNRVAWIILGVASAILIPVFLFLGSGWQQEIHELMGAESDGRYLYLGVLILGALLFAGLVGLGRLLRRAARALTRFLGRWIPAPAARLVGTAVVVVLAIFTFNGVILDGLLTIMDNSFKTVNGETKPGVAAPTESTRSGGPGSLITWASLGNEGRRFAAGGPTQAELQQFSGAAPQQPIRIYAGLESAPSTPERAALAVRDLQRAGGFSRKVLLVVTTTGTGWVDAKAIEPLEYMYNGDTALIGMQYSYLPSWLSFLVDKARAKDAGRELFDEVYRVWSVMPVGQRPKLLVFGESLGSFGGESAFSGAADMRNRTDGILFLGPPNDNTLWREFVADRDAGTPQIEPTYRNGVTVQFATDPNDLPVGSSSWTRPRVVYLQHPSDPIVWWSPGLLLNRPDWLSEERGDDVLPNMRWYPFVTFWQTSADMAFSTGVPGGHGHNYGVEPVKAWLAIAAPDGWTADKTAALEKIIAGSD